MTAEVAKAMESLSVLLTSKWQKQHEESYSIAACVELVHVLFMYRTDIINPKDKKNAREGAQRIRERALIGVLRDVSRGKNCRVDVIRGEREAHYMTPSLPGTHTLGESNTLSCIRTLAYARY